MKRRGLRKRYGRALDTSAAYDSVKPARRVQIIATGSTGYWKPGQYGYVIGYDKRGGPICGDKPYHGPGSQEAKPGEIAYMVSKSSHGRGGASWFSGAGLRFTRERSGK